MLTWVRQELSPGRTVSVASSSSLTVRSMSTISTGRLGRSRKGSSSTVSSPSRSLSVDSSARSTSMTCFRRRMSSAESCVSACLTSSSPRKNTSPHSMHRYERRCVIMWRTLAKWVSASRPHMRHACPRPASPSMVLQPATHPHTAQDVRPSQEQGPSRRPRAPRKAPCRQPANTTPDLPREVGNPTNTRLGRGEAAPRASLSKNQETSQTARQ